MANFNLEEMINREELKLATTRSRALSYVIDDLIISLFVIVIFYDTLSNVSDPAEAMEIINSAFLPILAIKVIYHTFFIWKYGQSIGKIATKIRVVQIDTLDNPDILFSFNRAIFRVISEVIFYLGFILAFFDKNRQSLHDKTSRTLVIDAN